MRILRNLPFYLLLSPALFLPLSSPAEPFREASVAADAVWYAHLDLEKALATTFGALVTERLSAQEQTRLRVFSRMFGFSILDDLRSVTLYGLPGHPDQGVVLIRGEFDRDYLTDIVAINETYSRHEHHGDPFHQWNDAESGKISYGAFFKEDLLLLTESEVLMQTALDTLSGRKKGLASHPHTASGIPVHEAAFLLGVVDFGRMDNVDPEAAILKEIDSALAAVAEIEDNLKFLVSLEAATKEGALNLQRVADGLIAFAILNKEKPGLERLASAISIRRNGRKVEGEFSFPVSELVDILERLR